ncbi:MAG: helix-turn-helix domain-containing protein [Pseudomonadota bacterium]
MSTSRKSPRSHLPLVRLNLVLPLVEALERADRTIAPVFARHNLAPDALSDSEMFVPASTMYHLVEDLATASGDPHFGVHVGEKLDPWSWSPLTEAAAAAHSVGDLLLRFTIAAARDASSVHFVLETQGERVTFGERRVSDGGLQPRHNDGFGIAYLLSIIRPAVGDRWDGSRVLARLCDPEVVPPNYFGIKVASTDTYGFSLIFPVEWMLLPWATDTSRPGLASPDLGPSPEKPAATIVDSLRQALRPHLRVPDLNTRRIAELCGMTPRTLARHLQAHGTSIQRELAALRRERAEEELAETDRPIQDIAVGVGYLDPAVFSRAFRRWTGVTPSEFRRRAREPEVEG